MKLIVGLGNPGQKYAGTRHNIGYRIAERFAEKHRIDLGGKKFEGRFGRGRACGHDVAVLLPETYMNLSGQSVAAALRMLPVEDPSVDVLVVMDDVDLPVGRIRLRPAGSAGGQRGLRDILEKLGREDIPRLRFGVGRPVAPGGRVLPVTADYVLQRFSSEDEVMLARRISDAVEAIEAVIQGGVGKAASTWNRDPEVGKEGTAEAAAGGATENGGG
jgi:PTH1 family peptidyl-tRNA hydrolase